VGAVTVLIAGVNVSEPVLRFRLLVAASNGSVNPQGDGTPHRWAAAVVITTRVAVQRSSAVRSASLRTHGAKRAAGDA